MAAAFGKIEAFEEASETWEHYTERLGHYFDANSIGNTEEADKNKRKAILLSVCGSKIYKLMSDLLAPTKPGEKSYDDLVKVVQDHHAPKPSEIVQRFRFNNRFREKNESVSEYVAALRNLSDHCNFGNTLEAMIRDRLVCGIANDRIQRRLLSEKDLTFKKAFDICHAMEMAAKDVIDLTSPKATPEQVNKIKTRVYNPPRKSTSGTPLQEVCYRCGGAHDANDCRFKETICFYCNRKGHIQDKCLTKLRDSQTSKHHQSTTRRPPFRGKSHNRNKVYTCTTEENDDSADEYEEVYTMYHMRHSKAPYTATMELNGNKVQMEIDTCSSLTVIDETTYKSLSNREGGITPKLKPSRAKLKTYTGEIIPILGQCSLTVAYKDFKGELSLIVVKGTSPCLMGRDWLQLIKLNWEGIFSISKEPIEKKCDVLEGLLNKYSAVFDEKLGKFEGVKARLYVDENVKPLYFKARPVAYALRSKIEKELERLRNEGTIEPVEFSEWATPIVPIVKADQSIRICGDYKVTVNQVSKLDNYPIPKTEDLYATLGGGSHFTKLDLSQAYQQLELDDSSKVYTTINTHKGLYRYNRLPYGISSAPGIFQRAIENLLQGIPQVVVRVDDILVTGKDTSSHMEHLEEVLSRLQKANVHLKKGKCEFLADEVVYLGHRINSEGIQPIEDKVRAITDSPAPTNVKELQAFLGMINYYACYLENLSTVLAPLHQLLQKDTKWQWQKVHIEAWNKAKDMLKSSKLLVHFDSKKPLLLSCDASPYGVGAVLAHIMPDGQERPIAYASRTLASAEQNYSQLEKEGLAVIFGVKKFHQYLYGHSFTIITDHKPLLGLLHANKAVPPMASPRVQRWALLLSGYEYNLIYRKGVENGNADCLSRLPLADHVPNIPIPGEMIMLMEFIDSTPVSAKQIAEWTESDPTLHTISKFILEGWPQKSKNECLLPFISRKSELTMHSGCIMWGNRVVIPKPGQEQLLEELHVGHPGIVRMKSLARSYIWWPGIDSNIELKVKACANCQHQSALPPVAPLHPWEWPEQPWQRLHLDYVGPFMGHMFLIVSDAYSKWLEVYPTKSSTSSVTIEKLRQCFATHGLPEMVVSDNGTCFTSEEFEIFAKENGIRHVKTSPYHPSSNGMAERSVRIFKEGLKKMEKSEGTLSTKLSRFLLAYHSTPQTTTGLTPAELLFNRKLRTRLDFVKPEIRERIQNKQQYQKHYHDTRAKERTFEIGDTVLVQDFSYGPNKWRNGTILCKSGPVSYSVAYEGGGRTRRHVDQIRRRHCLVGNSIVRENMTLDYDHIVPQTDSTNRSDQPSDVNANVDPQQTVEQSQSLSNGTCTTCITPKSVPSRPQRPRKPPSYLKDFVTNA